MQPHTTDSRKTVDMKSLIHTNTLQPSTKYILNGFQEKWLHANIQWKLGDELKVKIFDEETWLTVKVKIRAKWLTSTEQLHHQPQFILHHKGGIIRHNVAMVALAHSLDLFLQKDNKTWDHMGSHKKQAYCSTTQRNKMIYISCSMKKQYLVVPHFKFDLIVWCEQNIVIWHHLVHLLCKKRQKIKK